MRKTGIIALLILLSPRVAAAIDPPASGFLSVAGAGEKSYLAVGIELEAGLAATSVRWLNNDETSQATVRIVPGDQFGNPAVDHPGVAIESAVWASDLWMTADLAFSVGAIAERVFVVFEYPEYNKLEFRGVGGGCGIGYQVSTAGPRSLIGHDGIGWAELHPSIAAMVELETVESSAEVVLESVWKRRTGTVGDGSTEQMATVKPLALEPARPNPFNPSTDIVFRTGRPGQLNLSIFNVRGQLVRVLRSGSYPAGEYRVRWDGTSRSGAAVASGVYFALLTAHGERHSQRLVLLK